jgi:hypothetical protein
LSVPPTNEMDSISVAAMSDRSRATIRHRTAGVRPPVFDNLRLAIRT